jgi:hypothetical protein
MMTNPTSTRTVRGALAACVLALAVTGCGSGDGGSAAPTPGFVARAEQLCGGSAVSKDAAEALRVITGSGRFEPSDKQTTVAAAVVDLLAADAPQGRASGDICRIYPPDDSDVGELRVRWEMWDTAPEGRAASKFTPFPMGEQAGGAVNEGYVSFACRGASAPTPTSEHFTASVENQARSYEPKGDPKQLKRAYATVAHSFARALAKELGCDDDGGLKRRPALDPV